jgi:hypothetical protein
MKRLLVIAALLAAAVNASAATDKEVLAQKTARVGSKHRLCTCDASQYYGRVGYLQVQTSGFPTAWCYVPSFNAFGKANGGVDCALFTVLP